MRVLVTGGTGYVGGFIAEALRDDGHQVVVAARHEPPPAPQGRGFDYRRFSLADGRLPAGLLDGIDWLVHAAFHHAAGQFRGGEGNDPVGFARLNLDGSRRLFAAAAQAGVKRCVFLSSRAVYGSYPPGTVLREDMPCRPDTLYGQVKLDGETALTALATAAFVAISLRVTGVFGLPGQKSRLGLQGMEELVADLLARPQGHKWAGLFSAFLAGTMAEPRIGTEVHGDDVGRAVCRVFEAPRGLVNGQVFNLSDMVVDRRDLLDIAARITGKNTPLPAACNREMVSAMATDRFELLCKMLKQAV